MIVIIPLPLFFAQTVYGVAGLTAWVVIGIIWTICSAFSVVLYPLYESRIALVEIAKGIVRASFCPQHLLLVVSDATILRVYSTQETRHLSQRLN